MTTTIVVPTEFQNRAISTVFQGQQSGDDLSGGITGGYGLIKYRGKVWSIQYQQQNLQLMRDDGDGPRGSIDVIILKANAHLSKTWYEDGWDENSNNPPDCASANGVYPDAGVPKKQSNVCATCPRNQWNTAPNGGKGKACGDHRRLAVVPYTDIRNEAFGGALLLRCPAASLQDLAAFDARFKQMGYPYYSMAVKIAFDPMESFPKFVFQAIRPLTDDEAKLVLEMRNSAEVARVISEGEAQPQAQVAAQPPQGAFLEAVPPNAVAPTTAPVQAAPVQAAPVQQVAPAQPVQQAAPVQPAPVQPAQVAQPTTTTGFGAAAPAQPVQAQPAQPAIQQAPQQAAQATQPAPARQMTGFGATAPAQAPAQAATPQGNPQAAPVQQAAQVQPAQPAQPAPVQQVMPPEQPVLSTQPTTAPASPAFDQSLDDRLAALLSAGNAGAAAS